jgi:acetylornithine deacetylase/succinyl-diaminopimelate desuccinylase-like protein
MRRGFWSFGLAWFAGLATAAGAPQAPAGLQQQIRAWRQGHEKQVVQELADLVALRNVSSDRAADRADIQRNAGHVLEMLRRRGIAGRLLTAGDAPPAVYGELASPGAKHTVVLYAHYDGQPAEAADWGGADPWQPVLRAGATAAAPAVDLAAAPSPLDPEWRLFGRSTSDDKGTVVAILSALDALRAAGISPSCNLKLFFEGEEEAGSPHLRSILDQYADLLNADAWILGDGPVHQSRQMQVVFGARGVTDVEMTVYGPSRALHSGHYGNWAPNPAALLVQLLAALRGPQGEIKITGFYDDVRPLDASEKQAAAAMPPIEDALRRELGLAWNEGPGRLQDLIMRPALNVRGLKSGQVGEAARNAIPTTASASIDFRLVPDETPDKVRQLTEAYLQSQGYWVVHAEPDLAARLAHPRIVRLAWGDGYPGARTAMDLPAARAVVQAIEEGIGRQVLRVPMLGGSIPIYVFHDALKAPVVLVPIANHDNNQHAAYENLRLQNLWDGIEVYAGLLARLGKVWPAAADGGNRP